MRCPRQPQRHLSATIHQLVDQGLLRLSADVLSYIVEKAVITRIHEFDGLTGHKSVHHLDLLGRVALLDHPLRLRIVDRHEHRLGANRQK
jgi:hypothetical protein